MRVARRLQTALVAGGCAGIAGGVAVVAGAGFGLIVLGVLSVVYGLLLVDDGGGGG
ncbi:hypothetical protein ABZ738_05545 [Micromonospora sp. NPDC047793]|uniref:hypothetical protein n=1 Tax=Micromonospora sp. NPDC047793 TaxID=3154342 RepID=UPI0033E58819